MSTFLFCYVPNNKFIKKNSKYVVYNFDSDFHSDKNVYYINSSSLLKLCELIKSGYERNKKS